MKAEMLSVAVIYFDLQFCSGSSLKQFPLLEFLLCQNIMLLILSTVRDDVDLHTAVCQKLTAEHISDLEMTRTSN